jgi:hypothetical protein
MGCYEARKFSRVSENVSFGAKMRQILPRRCGRSGQNTEYGRAESDGSEWLEVFSRNLA